MWLVAAVEDQHCRNRRGDAGPIFKRCVVRPPTPPQIRNATDALAVVLNEQGRVDIDRIAELIGRSPELTVAELGERCSGIPRPSVGAGRRHRPHGPTKAAVAWKPSALIDPE